MATLDPAVPWGWPGPPRCHLGGSQKPMWGWGSGRVPRPRPALSLAPQAAQPRGCRCPCASAPSSAGPGGTGPSSARYGPAAQAPPLRVGVAGWVWPWVSPPAGGAWLGVFHQIMGWWHVSPCPGGPVCPWAMLAVHAPMPWWPRVSPSPGLVSVPLAWVAPCVPPGYRVVVSPCPGGSPCLWATG